MKNELNCPVCNANLLVERVGSASTSMSKKELLDKAFERIKAEASPSASYQYPKYALLCTCCIVPDSSLSSDGKGGGNYDFPYHIDRCPKHRG